MDMKIDSKLIVKLRKEKGWSQQHLSLASGVSLRTVQRVENEGNTSLETLKSLASAFETDFNSLIFKPSKPNSVVKKTAASFALLMSLAMSVFLTSTTTASPGVEVLADKMIVSQNKKETVFFGKVTMVIPPDVPFEISTIESHPNDNNYDYQLKITAEDSSFLALGARIKRVDTGLEISAAEMRTSNATYE